MEQTTDGTAFHPDTDWTDAAPVWTLPGPGNLVDIVGKVESAVGALSLDVASVLSSSPLHGTARFFQTAEQTQSVMTRSGKKGIQKVPDWFRETRLTP